MKNIVTIFVILAVDFFVDVCLGFFMLYPVCLSVSDQIIGKDSKKFQGESYPTFLILFLPINSCVDFWTILSKRVFLTLPDPLMTLNS